MLVGVYVTVLLTLSHLSYEIVVITYQAL
jgi:hypothetical protein